MAQAEHDVRIASLVTVVKQMNAAGDCWGSWCEEIARIAVRRWDTFPRRHGKPQRATHDARVLDLAKGLQAHFEPGVAYTHPSDWRALAEQLASVLRGDSA